LIDLDGIKNAWFVKTTHPEMPLFADKNSDGVWSVGLTKESAGAKEMQLNGLYDVYIDL
jgi:hypothetical protein